MRGYYAGLKSCLAGLTLVSDMTVTCFLVGGPIINVMYAAAGYKSANDFLQDTQRRPLDPRTSLIYLSL